ncbi:effector-associated constant component EACC1 [Streptomyces shenzhenensis]
MRITLAVHMETGDRAGASDDLYGWLRQDPELRGLVRRESPLDAPAGAMGASSEVLTLVLAPDGPTAAVGAAVVVWLQNRRGNQTVTIHQPAGTQVVVSAEQARALTAQGAAELAQRLAEVLRQSPATDGSG